MVYNVCLPVAHSEVYGYGFRAYEFNPPPEVTSNTPQVRREEQRHGLSAMRSYLLPHVYVTVTWLLQRLGLHFPPFLVRDSNGNDLPFGQEEKGEKKERETEKQKEEEEEEEEMYISAGLSLTSAKRIYFFFFFFLARKQSNLQMALPVCVV